MNSLARLVCFGILPMAISACTQSPAPEVIQTTPPAEAPAASPPTEKPDRPEAEIETAPIKEIDITQLFTLKTDGKTLIYDVRLPLYYQLGHIDGAILFYPKPFDEAFDKEEAQMKNALSEGKEIVLYCGGADCHDSHIVAKMIAERGIPVSVYSGGWAEWKTVGIE
ncbi:rhodanese-like domain-containing protein [Haloferula chungangensis]|uniref:Rhodanese-like domain-containing protein n=1 Tax=Haloferula chungangensis TaxID=1048331 RepID=A0ABW2LAI0_9BACT